MVIVYECFEIDRITFYYSIMVRSERVAWMPTFFLHAIQSRSDLLLFIQCITRMILWLWFTLTFNNTNAVVLGNWEEWVAIKQEWNTLSLANEWKSEREMMMMNHQHSSFIDSTLISLSSDMHQQYMCTIQLLINNSHAVSATTYEYMNHNIVIRLIVWSTVYLEWHAIWLRLALSHSPIS